LLVRALVLSISRAPIGPSFFPYTTLFRSCALDLEKHGVLEKFGVEMIGANADTIDKAEDRSRFDQAMRWCRRWHRSSRRRTFPRSEEHTSELQSREKLVCRLLLEKKKKIL